VTLAAGHGRGDVALTGPAARLLLVLVRRLPPSDPAVEVFGDADLLGRWLAETPF
jgi:MDMPI C-terminal domain